MPLLVVVLLSHQDLLVKLLNILSSVVAVAAVLIIIPLQEVLVVEVLVD
jgi:hypothetical protein